MINALTQIRNTGNNAQYICTDSRALAKRRLADLRGKVIMVFANEFATDFDHRVGVLPFTKYASGVATTSGLCTCGIYQGSSDMGKVHGNAAESFRVHAGHAGHRPDHLHFVYWQQTLSGGNIKAATTAAKDRTLFGREEKAWTGGAHANLGDFAAEIRQNIPAGTWRLPNVISHDFVTEQTCNPIIALNPNLV